MSRKLFIIKRFFLNWLTQVIYNFKKLNSSDYISYKEMKCFTYKYKKACNLGKLYLLARNHKRLFNVPGRPVISNCGTPTEKDSEFLDHLTYGPFLDHLTMDYLT